SFNVEGSGLTRGLEEPAFALQLCGGARSGVYKCELAIAFGKEQASGVPAHRTISDVYRGQLDSIVQRANNHSGQPTRAEPSLHGLGTAKNQPASRPESTGKRLQSAGSRRRVSGGTGGHLKGAARFCQTGTQEIDPNHCAWRK